MLIDDFLLDIDAKLSTVKQCVLLLNKHGAVELANVLLAVQSDYESVLQLNASAKMDDKSINAGPPMFARKHQAINGMLIDDDAFLGFEGDVTGDEFEGG